MSGNPIVNSLFFITASLRSFPPSNISMSNGQLVQILIMRIMAYVQKETAIIIFFTSIIVPTPKHTKFYAKTDVLREPNYLYSNWKYRPENHP